MLTWVAWSKTETECEWTHNVPEGRAWLRREDVGGNRSHWDTFPSHISSGIQGRIKYYMPSYCTLHRWANTILSVTKEQKSSWVSSVSEQRHKYDLIVVMFPSASVSWAVHMTSAALQCQAPNCTATAWGWMNRFLHGRDNETSVPMDTVSWLCSYRIPLRVLSVQS